MCTRTSLALLVSALAAAGCTTLNWSFDNRRTEVGVHQDAESGITRYVGITRPADASSSGPLFWLESNAHRGGPVEHELHVKGGGADPQSGGTELDLGTATGPEGVRLATRDADSMNYEQPDGPAVYEFSVVVLLNEPLLVRHREAGFDVMLGGSGGVRIPVDPEMIAAQLDALEQSEAFEPGV